MRAFVGFMAPVWLRERLTAEWERVSEKPLGLRGIPAESWHITLTFLGELNEENISHVAERLENWIAKAVKTPFTLTRLETFPSKNPRYLAAHFHVEQSETFSASVTRLRDVLSIYAPEIDRKPLHPHLSLAKAKNGLAKWTLDVEPVEWFPEEISIVKSIPGPDGSMYVPIKSFSWKP